MHHEAHIRLTLTRGEKVTSRMHRRLNTTGRRLIVLAERKPLASDNEDAIRVITPSQRRNDPQFPDSKIHHNNLLNNILAKVQANISGIDAAVMLDHMGFVSELNDANLFMILKGMVYTPYAGACLHGIARGLIVEMCRDLSVSAHERNLSLTEFYNADAVFATGSVGEVTPVKEIDGRKIINRTSAGVPEKIVTHFHNLIPQLSEKLN